MNWRASWRVERAEDGGVGDQRYVHKRSEVASCQESILEQMELGVMLNFPGRIGEANE